MRVLMIALLGVASASLGESRVAGQGPPPPPDVTIDVAMRREVIDGALAALNEAYVFPDVAKQMDAAVRARQRRGEYDAITSARQFAQLLTDHLREVSHDRHLSVDAAPQGPPPLPPPAGALTQTLEERQRVQASRQNFEFVRVERLAGNVGYVELHGFMPPAVAGDTAAAAMTFVASSDAVIFDLRQNGGGDPAMVAFLTSYLFGPQPVHLNDFYSRTTNQTRQSWTLPFVPGRRLTDTDVYILTSARTFSGGEEFTYNLKHLKRATVVGETTAGGAHTVFGRRINSQFMIGVPSGRPINPVTRTNWEGVGVEPDVKVPADRALKVAHLLALEKQQQRLTSETPMLRNEVTTAIASVRNELGVEAAAIATGADPAPAAPASQASDDFETGTLAGWQIDRRGPGGWFVYTDGKKQPSSEFSDSGASFDVPEPPQGKFAAIALHNAPGRFILYRDVRLDGRYRLHLTVFYVNRGRFFSGATVSSRNAINDEQQYRIDILSATAPVDSMAKEHVLATLFEAKPGDPSRLAPTDLSLDLSPWSGRTVRLRLAVGENQAPLHAGVDNVRFARIE